MRIPSRAMTWALSSFVLALVLASLFAMTGVLGPDQTILGSYTGMHIAGVVLAVAGVLALVAVLLRSSKART